jgi:hypothetical protein
MPETDYCVYMLQGYTCREAITKVGYTKAESGRFSAIREAEKKRDLLHAIDSGPIALIPGLSRYKAIELEAGLHDMLTYWGLHIENEWCGMPDDFIATLLGCVEHFLGFKVDRFSPPKTFLFDPDRETSGGSWKQKRARLQAATPAREVTVGEQEVARA